MWFVSKSLPSTQHLDCVDVKQGGMMKAKLTSNYF